MIPPRTFAIVDPAAGASGDMFLGALLAVGAPREWLEALPRRLGLDGIQVEVASTVRCGVRCVKVSVVQQHEDNAGAHGPHRHVGELIRRIETAPLSPGTRERAIAVFRLLGEAEGKVHGVPPERVTLHEVGAWDALVDIVGTVEGLERLGVEVVYTRPVALGDGWVRSAHGQLPVPAPATAILLEGLEICRDGPVRGEATTPTGAALLRALSVGPPPARWRAVRSGWGAGTRDPQDYPNALRLILAEAAVEAGGTSILATDLDDLSPEYLEPLREALVAAGAVDVQVWTTQMKKGRPGFRVEAVTPIGAEASVADAFFTHSTTTGVRWIRAERITLPRHERTVEVPGGTIRVKVVKTPGGRRIKPEFDDVARVARATGRPAQTVAAEARAQAEHLEAGGGRRRAAAQKEPQ
jgi:uncharacterized protein (TIGR00299 family) protein